MSEKKLALSKELSEIELALTDALKTILEVITQGLPGSEKYLARSFADQRDGKLLKELPNAAALFEMLRRFVADPNRQANREEIRKLLEEPPEGRA